jgi:hypothetical protein
LLSDRAPALGLSRLLTWAWAALLVGACVGGLIARKTPPRAVVYTVWADRDLGRAAAVPHDFPTSGPEFTRGSRTPGGLFYLFLWPQLLLTREPLVLHRLMNVLNVVALGLLAALGFRLAGKWAALVCAALFAACPAQLDLLRFVAYNPNYPLLPGVGAYWLFCDMLVFDRPSRLPFLVALVAAASQMHFSFILLLPAFLLVLTWHGRRFRRRDWVASAGALALLFGPYVVAEGLRGWPLVTELVRYQGLVTNSPWVTYQNTLSRDELLPGLRNLGYALFGTATGPTPVGGPVRILTLLGPAAFLATGAWGFRRRRETTDTREALLVRRLCAVLVLGLGALSLANSSFTTRYVLFLLPATLLVTALGAARLAGWLEARADGRAAVLAAALLAWTTPVLYLGTVEWVRMRSWPAVSLPEWRRLMGHLHGTLGMGAAELPLRTAVLLQTPSGFSPLSPETSGVSFLATRYVPDTPAAPGPTPPPCALVLVNLAGRLQESPGGDLPADAARQPLLEARRTEIARGRDVVAYRLADGNCLHNVDSRYSLTPEEQVLFRLDAPREGSVARRVATTRTIARYQVRLVGRGALADRALDLLLDVALEDGAIQATAHSNDLRGYDGITFYQMTRPRLVLSAGPAGPAHAVPFTQGDPGVLGGWLNPVRPPWHSPRVPLPPGRYSVELVWDDVQFEQDGGNEGPGRLALAEPLDVLGP